jgi:hypothetical protein
MPALLCLVERRFTNASSMNETKGYGPAQHLPADRTPDLSHPKPTA